MCLSQLHQDIYSTFELAHVQQVFEVKIIADYAWKILPLHVIMCKHVSQRYKFRKLQYNKLPEKYFEKYFHVRNETHLFGGRWPLNQLALSSSRRQCICLIFLRHSVIYITDCSKTVLLNWFSLLFVLVSVSVLFSPSMCLADI